MTISTRGWDNAYVPDKVFVERLQSAPAVEYSETSPSRVALEDLLNGFYASHNYMQLFYLLPEVFAPVHEIASRVSDAIWQLRQFSNDEVIYTDDNFNRLFTQPNPLNTMRQLVYQAVCFEIIVGKQFFFKNASTLLAFGGLGSISSWSNLPAQKVNADMRKDIDAYTATKIEDFVNRYTIPKADGTSRIFEVKDVLPVINFSLGNPMNINAGVSMIKGADKAIKNLIPVYEARHTIFIKRGSMGFWVSQKTDADGRVALTPNEKKAVRDEVDSTYGLTGGRSTVGVTDLPLSFEKSSMTISEMQPFDETLADAVAIYKVLRVPRHLVPSKDNSTFANADSDLKSFYSDVIIPWAKRYADLWTTWLGIDTKLNYKKYIYADFSHVDILQENKKERASTEQITGNIMLQRFNSGVASLNNWLVTIGEEEINLPVYKKKLGEMNDTEIETVKRFINLKTNVKTSTEDKGNQAAGSTGEL